MPRRSAAEKAETHERILKHAARAFRGEGTAVGIGDVMRELGLTHGGFYRHFESKEDLLVDAVSLALDEIADRLTRVAETAEPGRELAAIITAYLSPEHLQHPETWCALAALGSELGRLPVPVRKRLDGAMMRYMARLAPYLPGRTDDERRATFFVLFSAMAGAIAMIRAIGDRGAREQMLARVRDYYLATFAG